MHGWGRLPRHGKRKERRSSPAPSCGATDIDGRHHREGTLWWCQKRRQSAAAHGLSDHRHPVLHEIGRAQEYGGNTGFAQTLFLAGAMLVADSDMILTLPSRLARLLAKRLPLALLDLPLRLAPLSPAMIWHERFHRDPAHVWVRQQLVDVVASFNTAG